MAGPRVLLRLLPYGSARPIESFSASTTPEAMWRSARFDLDDYAFAAAA